MKAVALVLNFISIILILVGVYAFFRVGVNMAVYEKYPTTGSIVINFSGVPPYSQSEDSCIYPRLYYTDDGRTTRMATPEETSQEKLEEAICLRSVSDVRRDSKVNDISAAGLFLFLGLGSLIANKILIKS